MLRDVARICYKGASPLPWYAVEIRSRAPHATSPDDAAKRRKRKSIVGRVLRLRLFYLKTCKPANQRCILIHEASTQGVLVAEGGGPLTPPLCATSRRRVR